MLILFRSSTHDDQVAPTVNWFELLSGQLDVQPRRHAIDLGGGRFRVPGKMVFGAALRRVDPKLPESLDLTTVEDRLVLLGVSISRQGRAVSSRVLRGDPGLGAAVKMALEEWILDTSKLAPKAELIESVLPFEFRKKH